MAKRVSDTFDPMHSNDRVSPVVRDLFVPETGESVPVVIRTLYDRSLDVGIDCSHEAPLVVQADMESCDINSIMKRYEMTGHDAFADRKASGMFVDLASAPEFQVAMGVIASANEAFDSLPANVRKRFSNDPAEFLAFFEDPGNQEEAIKLGLAERLPDPTPPSLANNSSDADAGEGKE